MLNGYIGCSSEGGSEFAHKRDFDTLIFRIMPWQFGQLGLTEDGGNKIFKYADALIDGVCFFGSLEGLLGTDMEFNT